MAKYHYDIEDEVFKREDNRGRHLAVNISEAQRIVTLINLGYSSYKIEKKVSLSNPKSGCTTIETFVNNYKKGNIELPENAPAPAKVFQSLTDNDRLSNLEERVGKLEEWIEHNNVILKTEEKSLTDKVKSWIR